jgi:SH3-like domain-containing protein
MGRFYISFLGALDLFNSMKIKNILVTAIAPFLALSMQFTPSASAQSLSECTVGIIGDTPGSRVNLRTGGGTEYSVSAYLLVGQSAIILNDNYDRRMIREDSEGYNWYYIEYQLNGTRGWIREDFLYFSGSCY